MKRKKNVVRGTVPFIFVIAIIISILFNTSIYNKGTTLNVEKGILKIPSENKEGVFYLKGEFNFTASRFNCFKNPAGATFANLPASLEDSPLASKFGYACYAFHIEGLEPSLTYSLRIPQALSSASVFIDNEEIGRQGTLAKNVEEEVPSVQLSDVVFKSKQDGSADIVLNISNFTQLKSGFNSHLILGESSRMSKLFRSDLIFSTLIFASIFTVSTFLLLLFFFYTQAKFLIWFALASLSLAVRGTIFYPHLATDFFPDMTWHVYFVVRYISFPLSLLFLTVFIKNALQICIKLPYIIVLTISTVYALAILLLSPIFLQRLVKYYLVLSLFFLLYNLVIIFRGVMRKKEYAFWIFASIIQLVLLGGYGILVAASVITGTYLIHVASLFSIIIIAIMMLNIYSTSIEKIEVLRLESKNINTSLSRFVPEKIIALIGDKSVKDIKIGEYIEKSMPILSADIRSFTNTTERLSSQEVFDYLNEYFALIVPIIRSFNGIIPKYLGDGIFAIFPDGVSSAVQCAIKMQKALHERAIVSSKGDELKIGIGLDCARVLLGTIGNMERMDVIVISTAYKNSEMLQTSTKKYNSPIIISSSVFASLDAGEKMFARPIQLIKTAIEKNNLLYEVYASDGEEIKFAKNRTQTYLVEAFDAICKGNAKLAYSKFLQVAEIFPQDMVAKVYLGMFRDKLKAKDQ